MKSSHDCGVVLEDALFAAQQAMYQFFFCSCVYIMICFVFYSDVWKLFYV